MHRLSLLLSAGAALVSVAHAQVRFNELTTIDLATTSNSANPEFIGSNPTAVAWNGTHLWVAGFNNSVPGTDAGIVQVSNALTAPVIGTSFARIGSPNGRGYTGLDITGGRLAAAYDNGASDPLGYTVWDTATNTLVWSRAGRGSCSLGFDPGFPGGNPALGAGVAYTAFGSGRRALFDAGTGNDIYTLSTGMIILATGVGTFWRDMDFDESTGNIYLRAGNHLIAWSRAGDNSLGTLTQLYTPPMNSDFTLGQNVAFINRLGQDYVIYNQREDSTANQDFFQKVRVVRPDGTSVTASWGAFAPATGVGFYDFSWHAPSGTLALLDFTNRNVHIFGIDDSIGTSYCAANPNSTGVSTSIEAVGSEVVVDNSVTLSAERLPLNAFAFFLTSRTQGFVMNPGGSAGNLCLSGAIGRYVGPGQIMSSGAMGAVSLAIDLLAMPQPTGPVAVVAGETWNFQCWHRDLVGGAPTSNFSNGVSVQFQ